MNPLAIANALAIAAAVAEGLEVAGKVAGNLQTVIAQWQALSARASKGEEIAQEELDKLIARSRAMEQATLDALSEAAADG